MYINAVAKSVVLYLQHDFYNIIFKITYKLYIASGSPPPPPPDQEKIIVAHVVCICIVFLNGDPLSLGHYS
jgi:hypothetical protein